MQENVKPSKINKKKETIHWNKQVSTKKVLNVLHHFGRMF